MGRGRISRFAGLAIALLAFSGLVLRYGLLLSDALNFGESGWGITGTFFSYFTILTNLLVVVVFSAPGAWFRSARTRGSVTLYIVVVGVVYELLLRRLWHLEGLQFLSSLLLHDAVPLAVLAHWLFLREESALRWTDPFAWLAFPLGYLAYALARGAYMGWWAYPFIDASELGYVRVMINAAGLVAMFVALGLAMVAWDRRPGTGTSEAKPSLAPEEEEDLVELPGLQSW